MLRPYFRNFSLVVLLGLFSACANIIPPTGGASDTTAPKLLNSKPQDSLLNTRLTRLELKFDEYVTVGDVNKELQISPNLAQSPSMTAAGKTVILKIADSLLEENTTYTINLGKAIKDLHEGNPYTSKAFIFSTGAWFDSLSLSGYIMDAASGKRDSSGKTKILLYDAKNAFDIVNYQKPAYVATANSTGSFKFTGLPKRQFRVFALQESGDNLIFDKDDELIGFSDTTFLTGTDTNDIVLSIFKEMSDTIKTKSELGNDEKMGRKTRMSGKSDANNDRTPPLDAKTFNYSVIADTNNREKRTQDITQDLEIYFSRSIKDLNKQKIFLSADSNGIEVERPYAISLDSGRKKISLSTAWLPNSLYTLRILNALATDTGGNQSSPSKYIFRTKSDNDYGTMSINIPQRFVQKSFLIQVNRGDDSVYLQAIANEKVSLKHLLPGNYTIKIIDDRNKDGKWTSGELKTKRQAEIVIPYPNAVLMKAGWEHIIDFEQEKKEDLKTKK